MTLGLRDLAFLGGGAPAVAWTPAQLGAPLRVWLDGDDATTITLNGGNVSQWSDKSGLGNHYTQVVAAFQMQYIAGAVNGRAAVEALVPGEFMDGAATTAMDGSGMSAFVVARQTSAPSILERILFRDNSVWVGSWFFDLSSNFLPNTINAVFGDGSSWTLRATSNTPYGAGTTRLVGATVTSGGSATTYVDGTAASTLSMSWANFTGDITLGHPGGGSQMFLGPICEVLIMVDVITQADRQKVEGYLAHKWWGAGAANSLPGGHPYKSTAPTV